MKKIIFILIFIFGFLFLLFIFLLRPPYGISQNIKWGMAFSKPFAVALGLDWEESYLAILDDLKPKSLRLPIYWQDVEPQAGEYFFDDYDWLIGEAQKRGAELILVVGRKLPRWPECHEPNWIKNEQLKIKNEQLSKYLEAVVNRYKDEPNLYAWQIENEPFLPYGECPELDVEFLDKEIALVRSLDFKHPIIVTDSGELSIWLRAVKRADIFGTTMYRIIWNKYTGYIKYPLPPKFFWLKANLIHLFYPNKPIIVSELQAEPWGPKLIYEISLEEQFKSMNLEQFYDNIKYAKEVGFPEVYLWGVEWWYWLKEKKNRPEFWEGAKNLF